MGFKIRTTIKEVKNPIRMLGATKQMVIVEEKKGLCPQFPLYADVGDKPYEAGDVVTIIISQKQEIKNSKATL